MALLNISGLHLEVDGRKLLSGIELSLRAGEVLGLVGESGSGKSMTAISVLGLLPPGAQRSGTIDLAGRDLLKRSERELCAIRGSEIGMVFQEPMTALNPLLRIDEQVAEVVRTHRRVSRREALMLAHATLERVGLPASRVGHDRYPHTLSGGQRQRVAIAMAIVLKPKLLIADEPTTALDVSTQARILELLRELVRENACGLLLVSHDLGVIAEIADEVAVMERGRIVEHGAVARVLRHPQHPYTQALLANSRPQPAPAPPIAGTGAPLLEVNHVVCEYPAHERTLFRPPPSVRAVDGVSLRVDPGERVGLVGESGCGKSTLLRAILGLETLRGGTIRVAGAGYAGGDTASLQKIRRQIQIVFQDPHGSLNPRWRVADVVGEPFHLWRGPGAPSADERRRRIASVLERVGLSAADGERFPHEFSGGQRQRIAIARALVCEPRLLVLDEAVSALDVSIRAQILELLGTLSRELGLAYLFVSHDIQVVRAVTDRLYVMQRGRVVESGRSADVLAHPWHDYTATLVAASPDLDLALARRFPQSANVPVAMAG
ncbi:dipeptide ABC transporter ATP-binding protein [Rhodocyclus tenuis]|uniref:dipeptide ABC transporter ATP-binding protein n=1 Tax=Rhodocyclus gracilis TaxID=2929842 RepID=UPI00129895C6|nr:ABC transporter ATP-binding protein [Rhodocyclus gracilis]MRD73963.1 dipeptide ABC transporter ATP-binding protein [Rhodocyclus gracilis]